MLRRFLDLPIRRRFAVVQACVALVAVQVGLRVWSYAAVRRGLDLVPSVPGFGLLCRVDGSDATSADAVRRDVAWAVAVADTVLPGEASCLERALVGEQLLVRRGLDARIEFGVDGTGDELSAHAWLESGGEVVLGGGNLDEFSRLAGDSE